MEMNTLYFVLFVIGVISVRAILEELPMWKKRRQFQKDLASGKVTYGHVYTRCVSMELDNTMDSLIWCYKNDMLAKKEGVVVFEGYVASDIA